MYSRCGIGMHMTRTLTLACGGVGDVTAQRSAAHSPAQHRFRFRGAADAPDGWLVSDVVSLAPCKVALAHQWEPRRLSLCGERAGVAASDQGQGSWDVLRQTDLLAIPCSPAWRFESLLEKLLLYSNAQRRHVIFLSEVRMSLRTSSGCLDPKVYSADSLWSLPTSWRHVRLNLVMPDHSTSFLPYVSPL